MDVAEQALIADLHANIEGRLLAVGACVELEREGPHGHVTHHIRYFLQRGSDQEADVLANDHVVHAGQFGRLGMVPGVLDDVLCLPKRHADRYVVHRKLEPHDVFDDDLVPIRIVPILDKQIQGVGLLVGLLGGLLGDRVGHVVVTVVVTVGVGKHLFVTKEQVANDCVDDTGVDVVVQRVVFSVM